jgi:hypothetical protein
MAEGKWSEIEFIKSETGLFHFAKTCDKIIR